MAVFSCAKKVFSFSPDLQATDKYKIYSTKASMCANLTGHAPPLPHPLQLKGRESHNIGFGGGAVILLGVM